MSRKSYLDFLERDVREAFKLPHGVITLDPQETEAASQAIYKAPRIALADIEAEISQIAYMTGDKFLSHAEVLHNVDKAIPVLHAATVTICVVTMKNGWMIIGMSAPASPENFDRAHGQKLAYDRCIMQIWPLMGYQLKEQLHHGARATT